MSASRAAGIEVTLKRRFGGHGGIATEWEITTSDADAKALIRSLPVLPLIGHEVPGDEHRFGHGIDLPEGVTPLLAGEIAACLAGLDDDALAAALHRASAEGAAHLATVALTERLGAWAATQETFTAVSAALALGIPEWRAHAMICDYLPGRVIPLDDGTEWTLTPEERRRVIANAQKKGPTT